MNRRGASSFPSPHSISHSSTVKLSSLRSLSGMMARLLVNHLAVFLVVVALTLCSLSFLSVLTDSSTAKEQLNIQRSLENRITKVVELEVSLETVEANVKALEGEKSDLSTRLDLVQKKFSDSKTECEKAAKNARKAKTEMDDRVHHALTEVSQCMLGFHQMTARSDEMEEVVRRLTWEQNELRREKDTLGIQLAQATQRGDAAEDEIRKIKFYYNIRLDPNPPGMYPSQLQMAGDRNNNKANPVRTNANRRVAVNQQDRLPWLQGERGPDLDGRTYQAALVQPPRVEVLPVVQNGQNGERFPTPTANLMQNNNNNNDMGNMNQVPF